ncbi:ARM repeat-containing protein [Meredithblackwellia eburnea MCA 4105]
MAANLSPESRPAHVATLISGVDRYNPSNCHLLEDYLRDQLAKDQYDLLANLALLKLYQFNPTLCSPSAVLSILLLALAHAPFNPDFSLAWSLLGDSFVIGAALPPAPPTSDDEDEDEDGAPAQRPPSEPHGEKETAQLLKELNALLLARKFKVFWQTLKSSPLLVENPAVKDQFESLVASAVGFEDRVRDSISLEIVESFKGLSKKTLESFLGLEASSPSLSKIVEKRGWKLEGDVVQIAPNESNAPTSTLQRESITVDQLSRVFITSQA